MFLNNSMKNLVDMVKTNIFLPNYYYDYDVYKRCRHTTMCWTQWIDHPYLNMSFNHEPHYWTEVPLINTNGFFNGCHFFFKQVFILMSTPHSSKKVTVWEIFVWPKCNNILPLSTWLYIIMIDITYESTYMVRLAYQDS